MRIATESTPLTKIEAVPRDPNGRKPGHIVKVTPDDYGKVAVEGEIVALSPQHIAICRHDPVAGDIIVHFPRAGFVLT